MANEHRLFEKLELVEALSEVLPEKPQLEFINKELKFRSYAAFIYKMLCKLVHQGYANDRSFSNSTYKGESVSNIDFKLIYDALENIFSEMKKLPLEKKKRFIGHY